MVAITLPSVYKDCTLSVVALIIQNLKKKIPKVEFNAKIERYRFIFTMNIFAYCMSRYFYKVNISKIIGLKNLRKLVLQVESLVAHIINFCDPCQAHKDHLTSKHSSKTLPVLPSFDPSYLIIFFYLPRCTLPNFLSVSSLSSLPFLSCCHQTTTTSISMKNNYYNCWDKYKDHYD